MRTRMIAIAAGIMLAAALPVSPPAQWQVYLLLVALLLILCLFGDRCLPRPVASVTLLLAAVALGICWALFRAGLYADRLLPGYLQSVDFWASGTVVSIPRDQGHYRQFVFHIKHSCYSLLPGDCSETSEIFRNRKVLLNDYSGLQIRPGQQWQLRVRLRRPRSSLNPAGRDHEALQFQQGISASGYVRETRLNQISDDRLMNLARMRQALLARLLLDDVADRQAAIIRALVVGERADLSPAQWELFTRTGTNHLMVISGLHVGFVAWAAWLAGGILARGSTALMTRLPAQQWGALLAVIAALAYAMLAGFSLPTQRALIMVLVLMAGYLSGQRYPASLGLTLALLAVLVLDPLAVKSAGFWLSFGAVASLLLAFAGQRQAHKESGGGTVIRLWERWGKAQWVVFVGLLTPLAVWMQQISLLSPLANILAIPLVSLLVVPLCLSAVLFLPVLPGLSALLWRLAGHALGLLEWALEGLSSHADALALLPVVITSPVTLLLAVMASLLLLMPRGWPGRVLALCLILPLFWPDRPAPEYGEAEITVFDVGQGLAVLVRTEQHTLLFDTGPGGAGSDAGTRILLPYLQRHSVTDIDGIMISHWHDDHSGGLNSVMDVIPVENLWAGSLPDTIDSMAGDSMAGDSLTGDTLAGSSNVMRCRDGMDWRWDGVRFQVLHPAEERYYARENDNSCVLRIATSSTSLLLTGDIESAAEAELLQRVGGKLVADILQVPHHGSRSSSGAAFLDAVSPAIAIVSAGLHNRFDHPHDSVHQRYQARSVRWYSTAQNGAITFRLARDEQSVPVPEAYRQSRPRYWRQP